MLISPGNLPRKGILSKKVIKSPSPTSTTPKIMSSLPNDVIGVDQVSMSSTLAYYGLPNRLNLNSLIDDGRTLDLSHNLFHDLCQLGFSFIRDGDDLIDIRRLQGIWETLIGDNRYSENLHPHMVCDDCLGDCGHANGISTDDPKESVFRSC